MHVPEAPKGYFLKAFSFIKATKKHPCAGAGKIDKVPFLFNLFPSIYHRGPRQGWWPGRVGLSLCWDLASQEAVLQKSKQDRFQPVFS